MLSDSKTPQRQHPASESAGGGALLTPGWGGRRKGTHLLPVATTMEDSLGLLAKQTCFYQRL